MYAFAVNLILLPLSLANGVLIARVVGPTGKGAYDLILACAGLLIMVLGFSLAPGITYVVARGTTNIRALGLSLLKVAVAQAAATLLILILLTQTRYSHYFLPSEIGSWLIIGISIFVFFELVTAQWRAMLVGRQEIAKVSKAELLGRILQFLLLFSLAFALTSGGGRMPVAALFIVSITTSMIISLLLLVKLRLAFKEATGPASLADVTKFALPCYLGNLVQFLNYRLDVFIVSFFAGYAAVGKYTLAVGLGQLIWMFSNAAATVLLPKVAVGEPKSHQAYVARVSRVSLGVSFVGALVLAIVSYQLIPLLYGEAFRDSLPALRWILPGIVSFSTVNILAAYLAGVGKPRLNLLVGSLSLVVTIAFDLLLIPRFNIAGAAMASSVSYIFSAILTIRLFIRHTGIPLHTLLLPTSDDLKFTFMVAQPFLRRAGLLGGAKLT